MGLQLLIINCRNKIIVKEFHSYSFIAKKGNNRTLTNIILFYNGKGCSSNFFFREKMEKKKKTLLMIGKHLLV